MSDDAPTGHDPRDHEFARWLHALAEMVERNPDLAELVRRRATPASDRILDGKVEGEIIREGDRMARSPGAEATRLEKAALPGYEERGAEESERESGNGRSDGRDASHPYNHQEEVLSDLPSPSADGEGLGVGPLLRHTRRSSRYGPPSVSGRPPELGTGIPDPFALFARDGAEGLRGALETLRIGSLRAIIRAHNLDPQGKLPASATEKRLITAIVVAAQRAALPNPTDQASNA